MVIKVFRIKVNISNILIRFLKKKFNKVIEATKNVIKKCLLVL